MTDEQITAAYAKYWDPLCGRAWVLLRGVRNVDAAAVAQDLVQETFESLMPRLRRIEPTSEIHLRKELYSGLRKRHADWVKRELAQKRDAKKTGRYEDDPAGQNDDAPTERLAQLRSGLLQRWKDEGEAQFDPALRAEGDQIEARFWARAAEVLPPEWVDVFEQFIYDGVEITELAKAPAKTPEYQRFHDKFTKYRRQLARLLAEVVR
jgi:hypothetical protein